MDDKDTYEEVGQRIRVAREYCGLSRSELAVQTGISQKFLYEIETGRKGFTINILKKISDCLNISCDYIVKGDERYRNTNLITALNLFEYQKMDNVAEVLKEVHKLIQ